MDLTTSVSELTRVGKSSAKRLEYLGIKTAKDLLYYFPFRYEDYRKIVSISQLRGGESVTVCGQVELIANKKTFRGRRMITEALVSDKSGSVRVVWFNQPFLTKNIRVGDIVYLSGKTQADAFGPKFVGPIYEKYQSRSEIAPHSMGKKEQMTHTARLVPIYPSTFGLTQKQIRFLVSQVIGLADKIGDWLPENILDQADLSPLSGALRGIHFPADDNDLKLSLDRLKFDELLLAQLRVELARQERAALRAPAILFKEDKIKNFVISLSFALTRPQKISAWEILQDIVKTKPMNRLLSGDVGSGKTVVAAIAIYNAFLNGYQAAMMAPTEILAQQHYQSLAKLFERFDINVGLLTGSLTKKQKKEVINEIRNGHINVAVGTHALLTECVDFKNLGIVAVDEQHRFGVEQRKLIKEKALGAHFLSMTATPIPRSLALMVYGDLDVSIINEMPPGRKKIITKMVEPAKRNKAYQFIWEQVKQGRQAFVICPLIEVENLTVIPTKEESLSGLSEQTEIPRRVYPALDAGLGMTEYANRSRMDFARNDSGDKKTVMAEYEKLSKIIFPDLPTGQAGLRVGYLHGKLKPTEKEKTMSEFKQGRYDILVSTSIIEVGVDVPNASIIIIEGAESFGLAQLHQFRGRVGRSVHQSYCLLFTSTDSAKTLERLKFFEQIGDGFKLAEKDLETRGPGEVYGTEQSGIINLRLAKLTDVDLIKKARDAAKTIVSSPGRYSRALSEVKDWKNKVHLE